MQSFIAQTRKVGDQIVVALSKELVQAEKIGEGTLVKISVQKVQKQGFSAQKKDDSLGIEDPWRLLE
jgi:hypothetical protein